MPASKSTVTQVAAILTEELGIDKAIKLVHRLAHETKGNNSYVTTVRELASELSKLKRAAGR